MPARLKTNLCRSSGRAWKRRGNHANGTPSVRPSSSSTTKLSSLNLIPIGSGEVVIPGTFNLFRTIFYNRHKLRKHFRGETLVVSHSDFGSDPELCSGRRSGDMDVHRFARIAFVGKEMEAIAIPIEDLGHVKCLTAEGQSEHALSTAER